jgi:nucleoid DNA-binding protein
MKKSELAREIATRQRLATGVAADQMDKAVNRLVRALRKGQDAKLPGLGTLKPGSEWSFQEDDK